MGPVHCKRCNNQAFANFSELRRHQWKKHKPTYANVGYKASAWSPAQRAKYEATIEAKRAMTMAVTVRDVINVVENTGIAPIPEMSARQLLEKLRGQQSFMNDVVALVEGLVK